MTEVLLLFSEPEERLHAVGRDGLYGFLVAVLRTHVYDLSC
jgi:hypothetical protein